MSQVYNIAILIGSKSDIKYAEAGLEILKNFKLSFQLRIASAHRTPKYVHSLCDDFLNKYSTDIFICMAGKSAHLAGVVASIVNKPVLAVPIYLEPTSGFDSLLSMVNMPKGVPVATFGYNGSGFANACIFAAQVLSTKQIDEQKKSIAEYRKNQENDVKQTDKKHQISQIF
jgi:phosphoribosylaminoimidazole carboxylase PurE protein